MKSYLRYASTKIWAKFYFNAHRLSKVVKMIIVHSLTFHQARSFLSSGSDGWPSMWIVLPNIVKNKTIHELKVFGSQSCLGISTWKRNFQEEGKKIMIEYAQTSGVIHKTSHINGSYINRWPEYFAYVLD